MRRNKTIPCQECRDRHVKCDGQKPKCHRCKRTGSSCVWHANPSGFRHGSSASALYDFADDQPWLPAGKVKYKYVDETAEIARQYVLELDTITSSPTISEKPRINSCVETRTRTLAETSVLSDAVASHSDQFLSPPELETTLAHYSPYAGQLSPVNHSSLSLSPPFSHSSNASSGFRDSFQGIRELPNLDEHEACLMRYFVVELAPWFDICDGERNFACTVPLRARTCPPLLNAIYTASARHLSRIKKHWDGNQVHYGGKALPNLTPETAIHYHNECIAHFVSISDHSREAQDENLLAAAVILRFYEEVDFPSMGQDTESALRGIQIFLDAQIMSAVTGYGLRHATYWIAIRQEITTAFSKQRTFRLPLGPCEPYRSFEPADDYVWADRLVIHCADVLQYCYGSEEEDLSGDRYHASTMGMGILHQRNASGPDMRIARYEELVAFETLWNELGPPSFKPIYSREPDRSRGEVFPELWYLNNCHVALDQVADNLYDLRQPMHRLSTEEKTITSIHDSRD